MGSPTRSWPAACSSQVRRPPSGSVNRRTTVSVGTSGRLPASRVKAPPVSTGESWWGSPTSSSFAPAAFACSARAVRWNVPARPASSTISNCPGRSDHRSNSARAAASCSSRRVVSRPAAAARSRTAVSSAMRW